METGGADIVKVILDQNYGIIGDRFQQMIVQQFQTEKKSGSAFNA